jgi:hypothetical protein
MIGLSTVLLGCDPQVIAAVSGERPSGAGGAGSAGAANGGGGATVVVEAGAAGETNEAGAAGAVTVPGDAGAGGGPEPSLRGDALIHRYSFDGMGTLVWDSKGGAHGITVNTELAGMGVLELEGLGTLQHVELPDGLVSGLGDASFEVWITWHGGDVWQRVFDFGSNFLAPNGVYSGARYLFLTPSDGERLRAVMSTAGAGEAEIVLWGASAVVVDRLTQLAVVVDDVHDTFTLYRDGVLEASSPLALRLAEIDDVNNWLGRSQFETDAELGATVHEFRIYDVALNADEIRASFEAGPVATLNP